MTVSWDALRTAAATLLFRCLEKDDSPGFGGQAAFTGGPGHSAGYPWPEYLVLTMGRNGVVETAGNGTLVGGSAIAGGGNGSHLQLGSNGGALKVVDEGDLTSR